jgi:hypothetical protein
MVGRCVAKHCDRLLSVYAGEHGVLGVRARSCVKSVLQRLRVRVLDRVGQPTWFISKFFS